LSATPLHFAIAADVDRELGPGRNFHVFAFYQCSQRAGQQRNYTSRPVAVRTGSGFARSQPNVFPRRRSNRIDAEIQLSLSPETFLRLRFGDMP
jgi:hypothetical protein